MALGNNNLTVTTTATAVTGPESDLVGGAGVAIKVPTGGSTVYVGPAGVTSATGYPVAAGESLYLDLDPSERVYLVTASGTQQAFVLARGV